MTLSSTPNAILKISGELDICGATALREALLERFAGETQVTVDLSDVKSCDAAALQVLLAGAHTRSEKTLRFTALSPAIAETAAALGLAIAEDVKP